MVLRIVFVMALAFTPLESRGAVKFEWPAPASADVHVHIEGKRGTDSWNASSSYTLRTEAKEDEIRVTRSEAAAWAGKGTGAPVDRIVDVVPTIRVSRSGEFLGIDGASVAATRARKILPKDMPEAAVTALTSEVGLAAMQKDFWLMLVQAWVAFDPEEGEVTTLTNRTKVPQLGGGELNLLLEVRRSAAIPCESSDIERRCVEFHLLSRPEKSQIEKLLTGVDIQLRAYDMSQEVRVVTDPTTLLPYKAVFSRSVLMAEKTEGSVPLSEEATRTYTFRWKPSEMKRPVPGAGGN
jgi:hypothetical protein